MPKFDRVIYCARHGEPHTFSGAYKGLELNEQGWHRAHLLVSFFSQVLIPNIQPNAIYATVPGPFNEYPSAINRAPRSLHAWQTSLPLCEFYKSPPITNGHKNQNPLYSDEVATLQDDINTFCNQGVVILIWAHHHFANVVAALSHHPFLVKYPVDRFDIMFCIKSSSHDGHANPKLTAFLQPFGLPGDRPLMFPGYAQFTKSSLKVPVILQPKQKSKKRKKIKK